jgi:ABC-type Mn2+/Zn2+ transport system permease subunit
LVEGSILYSLVVGAFVGSAAGYLGSIMISKHMALVGDALSHVALPGLAIGILLNFNPFLGAFFCLAITAVATWEIQKSTSLSMESIIGVLFVLALAIGILITPQVELYEALFGDIAAVTQTDAVVAAVVSVAVVIVTRVIYDRMFLSMISSDLAVSAKVDVNRINLVYLFLVATIVTVGIKEVGTLLVGAVVITPAVAAKSVSTSLRSYSILSAFFGFVSATLGVVLASYTGVPAGPLVVIIATSIFAVGLGVTRGRRMG